MGAVTRDICNPVSVPSRRSIRVAEITYWKHTGVLRAPAGGSFSLSSCLHKSAFCRTNASWPYVRSRMRARDLETKVLAVQDCEKS